MLMTVSVSYHHHHLFFVTFRTKAHIVYLVCKGKQVGAINIRAEGLPTPKDPKIPVHRRACTGCNIMYITH